MMKATTHRRFYEAALIAAAIMAITALAFIVGRFA